MEGSNKYHKEFADAFSVTDKGDWFKLKTKEHKEFYENKGCSYKKIYCPKCSIVFWDSRTIHCGCEALRTRIEKNFRAIIYLCYTPKSLLTTRYEKKNRRRLTKSEPQVIGLINLNFLVKLRIPMEINFL